MCIGASAKGLLLCACYLEHPFLHKRCISLKQLYKLQTKWSLVSVCHADLLADNPTPVGSAPSLQRDTRQVCYKCRVSYFLFFTFEPLQNSTYLCSGRLIIHSTPGIPVTIPSQTLLSAKRPIPAKPPPYIIMTCITMRNHYQIRVIPRSPRRSRTIPPAGGHAGPGR